MIPKHVTVELNVEGGQIGDQEQFLVGERIFLLVVGESQSCVEKNVISEVECGEGNLMLTMITTSFHV